MTDPAPVVDQRRLHLLLPVRCSVAPPPYDTLASIDLSTVCRRSLPLATVVHVSEASVFACLGALSLVLDRSPWCIPCLTLSPTERPFQPLLGMVTDLSDRIAILPSPPAGSETDPTSVMASVAGRSPPDPEAMASYVARRIGDLDWREPLQEQFARALHRSGLPRSPSTYSRFFAHHGRYTARDWRAIARLVAWLASGPEDDDRQSVPAPPIPMQTAERHTRRFLRVSVRTARQHAGWEWLLEAALRHGAYVDGRAVTSW